jgi:hypothetical protein
MLSIRCWNIAFHEKPMRIEVILKTMVSSVIIVIATIILPVQAEAPSGLANSPWPMYQNGLAHMGQSTYDGIAFQPLVLWKYPLPQFAGETGGMSMGSNGWLYIAATNRLHAFDPFARKIAWTFEYADNNRSVPTVIQDGSLLWGFGDTFAVVSSTGTLSWGATNLSSNFAFATNPVIDSNSNLYFTHDGMWSFALDGTPRWVYGYTWYAHSSPAIGSDGTIYGSGDGGLYAFNPSGTVKWFISTLVNTYDSSPAIAPDGTIYVPTYNGRLSAYEPDASFKWEFRTDESAVHWDITLNTGLAIGPDGTLYFSVFDGAGPIDNINVYAVNPDGSLKWKYPIPNRQVGSYTGNPNVLAPIVVDKMNRVFVCAHNSSCYALSSNGTRLWEYFFPPVGDTPVWVDTAPLIAADGRMYILDSQSILYALAEPTEFEYLPAVMR